MGDIPAYISTWLYGLSWPIVILAGIGIIVCVVTIIQAGEQRSKHEAKDVNWGLAAERQIMAIKALIAFAILYAVAWGCPPPDFQTKIVYRDRKTVEIVPYKSLFDECYNQMITDYRDPDEKKRRAYAYCHTASSAQVREQFQEMRTIPPERIPVD